MSEQRRTAAVGYSVLAAAFVAFGSVAILSIGAPFVLTGAVMLVVGRWRRNRAVLWPALVAVWAFVAGYVLVAPLGCTTSSTYSVSTTALPGALSSVPSHTVCTNVLGIDYSGTGSYDPSLLPGVLAGLAAAVLAGVLTRLFLLRSRSRAVPAA